LFFGSWSCLVARLVGTLAATLADAWGLHHAEGIARPDDQDRWVHHAWNVDGEGHAVAVTGTCLAIGYQGPS
jgi:hypothetical protein